MAPVIRGAILGGAIGGLAMVPLGLVLTRWLDRPVNVYGELVVQAILGRRAFWALIVQHVLISWVLAIPLVLLAPRRGRARFLALGVAYGAVVWVAVNSLALPILFGRPTPWQTGWAAIWPSLTVHLVYGLATAAAVGAGSRVNGSR
jgi:hypothetical protein